MLLWGVVKSGMAFNKELIASLNLPEVTPLDLFKIYYDIICASGQGERSRHSYINLRDNPSAAQIIGEIVLTESASSENPNIKFNLRTEDTYI